MPSSDQFLTEEMSAENLDEPAFCWGKKKGVGFNKGVQFYESFTYDGVEYALYDSVYMYDGQRKELPHIGMLVKIWETERSSRKVKVHWFFHAAEISQWLRKYNLNALDNELFFATGDGVGLHNINSVESIAAKCSVICISNDSRNPQPSAEHLRTADYVFYRTFDVEKYVVSEKLGDKVGGIEAKYVFNRHNIEMITGPKILPKPSEKHGRVFVALEEAVQLSGKHGSISGCEGEKSDASERINVRKHPSSREDRVEVASKFDVDPNSLVGGPSKKARVEESRAEKFIPLDQGPKIRIMGGLALASNKEDPMERKSVVKVEKNPNHRKNQVQVAAKIYEDPRSSDEGQGKKRKVECPVQCAKVEKKNTLDKGPSIVGLTLAPNKENPMERKSGLVEGSLKVKLVVGKIYDITQRPKNEKGKWFNSNPWDLDSMKCAQDERRLILVENLHPRYTSRDVEDIMWSALQVNCTAKVVQRTPFSTSLYGQALAILKTRDAAEKVVRKLKEECLLISGKRALSACIVNIPKHKLNRRKCKFAGHLSIDRIKLHREQKDARATCHHSQANTIEYELALEWCLLQSRHELAWNKLHKCHTAELSKCAASFKGPARGVS